MQAQLPSVLLPGMFGVRRVLGEAPQLLPRAHLCEAFSSLDAVQCPAGGFAERCQLYLGILPLGIVTSTDARYLNRGW